MWNKPDNKKLEEVPRLYATEGTKCRDKIIYLHFFIGGSDWYVAEFDGEDLFFGFAILNNDYQMAEWGYFTFSELVELKISWLEVDNDLHWKPMPAREIEEINKCIFGLC